MFTQKYKKFNLGIQNPVLSLMTPCTPLPLIFFLWYFGGPDGMLSIAVTRDLKENTKSLLVICTEHETWSNGK